MSPGSLGGQTLSARPASVSLTVVVPSPLRDAAALPGDERATLLQRSATTLDLETIVGLANHPASRIEVRLGRTWTPDSATVSVRNRFGEFEPLGTTATVVAMDAPPSLTRARAAVQFRVVSETPVSALAIPVEYRITIGTGDQIEVWTFPSVVRLTEAR
jgi:hypothetical protein